MTSDLRPGQAGAALVEIARLRVDTRRAWGSPCFALVGMGSVAVLAAAALVLLGPVALALTWLCGGVGGLAVTDGYYRRLGSRLGVTGRRGAAWRWSRGAFALCFVAAAIGGAHGREGWVLASIAVVLGSHAALGAWQRRASGPVAVAAAGAPAIALAALASAPWLVELVFGAGMIGAGAVLRRRIGRG